MQVEQADPTGNMDRILVRVLAVLDQVGVEQVGMVTQPEGA